MPAVIELKDVTRTYRLGDETLNALDHVNCSVQAGVLTISSDYADALGFKGKYSQLIGKKIGLLTQNWYTGVGTDPRTMSVLLMRRPKSRVSWPYSISWGWCWVASAESRWSWPRWASRAL